jgi:hypothetical protein
VQKKFIKVEFESFQKNYQLGFSVKILHKFFTKTTEQCCFFVHKHTIRMESINGNEQGA